MKLSKKLNHRNLDDMFRLILLIYGKKFKKACVKIYLRYFKEFHDSKFDKKRFLQQVQKIELIK